MLNTCTQNCIACGKRVLNTDRIWSFERDCTKYNGIILYQNVEQFELLTLLGSVT